LVGGRRLKKVVILGAGGFSREVLWIFRDVNEVQREWEVLGFIDENEQNHGNILCELPILGGFDWFKKGVSREISAICAVGSPQTRKRMVEKAKAIDLKFCSIIHPSVKMSKYVEVGEGTIIASGNNLTTQIKIGNHVMVNMDCTISHDSIIEDYCTIAPGVRVSGNVHLEKGVDFGTGSVIIQGVSVGAWSIIGAGAVVIRDVPSHVTAVGVPADVIKHHND
jgi:sugar O-acyltransferase (sialic acid O-acetyltransferase NeuD family)